MTYKPKLERIKVNLQEIEEEEKKQKLELKKQINE